MKSLISILVIGLLSLSITACELYENNDNQATEESSESPINKDKTTDEQTIKDIQNGIFTTVCNKNNVDKFISILGEVDGQSLLSGFTLDKKHCYNVTPEDVANTTNIEIFKFSDSCASFALIDDEVFEICTSFGGYGFLNAVPWDYDNNGNFDLLISSSWGSGLHRSQISVFNTTTKKSTIIYDTSTTNNPSIDLYVTTVVPSFSSVDIEDRPVHYEVCFTDIQVNENNLANLSCKIGDTVGYVEYKDGSLCFVAKEDYKF